MIRVAVIGTGNISTAHIEGYLAFPERCQIVALCDIFPEKAQAKKEKYQLNGADVVDDHEKLLDREDIDLVSVCTPPYCHASIAIHFLQHGKNVLVEKPMATSLQECDEMIDAARKHGKVLGVIAQNRFRDPIMKLKKVLDSGLTGRVLHAQIDSYWWRAHNYYDLWWRGTWEKEGGGCTLNHAVHHIDMLGWMMGLPKSVQALLSNAAHDNAEVEDVSIAALQYDRGAVAQITSSVIHHGEEQQVIFQTEKARVSAPWKVYCSAARSNGFPDRDTETEKKLQEFYDSIPPLEHVGHEGEIDNVLHAIETGTSPLITGEEGRRTIELITAIYKAGFEHRTVRLPIQKDDIYYTADGIQKNAIHFYEKTASIQELGAGESITLGSNYQ